MIYYVYLIFDKKLKVPIYAGTTSAPLSRYRMHKCVFNKLGINILMVAYNKFEEKEVALKEEKVVIDYLFERFPTYCRNKNMKNSSYRPILGVSRYKKIEWIILSENQRDKLFTKIPFGGYSIIAKDCGYDPERVRQIFVRKPDKIHPDIYKSIKKYRRRR